MTTILFIIAMFFAIWFTTVNLILTIHRQSIPGWNFVIMSASYFCEDYEPAEEDHDA